MKERPILFSGPMVKAILEGRKTQTRRIIKPQPNASNSLGLPFWTGKIDARLPAISAPCGGQHCPYGQPGDRLWVRETFGFVKDMVGDNDEWVPWVPDRPTTPIHELKFGGGYYDGHVIYAADGHFEWNAGDDPCVETCSMWHPSIHLPRSVSRILLEVVKVRVERLNEISAADAMAEGIQPYTDDGITTFKDYLTHEMGGRSARQSFQTLWESINGLGSWAKNPWVWVVEFKRVNGKESA